MWSLISLKEITIYLSKLKMKSESIWTTVQCTSRKGHEAGNERLENDWNRLELVLRNVRLLPFRDVGLGVCAEVCRGVCTKGRGKIFIFTSWKKSKWCSFYRDWPCCRHPNLALFGTTPKGRLAGNLTKFLSPHKLQREGEGRQHVVFLEGWHRCFGARRKPSCKSWST